MLSSIYKAKIKKSFKANTTQKGVMITHKNVIANMIQVMHTESEHRNLRSREKAEPFTQTVLGLLPMSHIYSLVVICHISVYRGDQVIVLPNFEMKSFLDSIRRFRINVLILVSIVPRRDPSHRRADIIGRCLQSS